MRDEFIGSLKKHQAVFGVDLSDAGISDLADYYDLVREHNPLLHLVGPGSPEEFAVRHALESLTLLEFLAPNTRFADVGTGAGLPSIPCMIVGEDLKAALIESKEKKARFLELAVEKLGLNLRAEVVNKQFEEAIGLSFSVVTCRALDKFVEKLPRLVRWARGREMLLFGGPGLRDAIRKEKLSFTEKLMPLSEQRYLFRIPNRPAR